jgi:hypothetical protein
VVVPLVLPGSNVTLVTNLAAGADPGAPLHVVRTEGAVAESYVDGLTIVKARKTSGGGKQPGTVRRQAWV